MKQRVKWAIGQAKRKAARLARMAARWAKAKLAALWRKSKAVAMSLVTACALTLPAFAENVGGQQTQTTGLTTIVSATDTVTEMVGKAWDAMTGNPLLRVYVAAGLLSVGIGFFGYLKRQSRH